MDGIRDYREFPFVLSIFSQLRREGFDQYFHAKLGDVLDAMGVEL